MVDEVKQKPDCTLSDGTPVFFDKRRIKAREWKALFDPQQADEEANQIIARFTGLPFEYVNDLSVYDMQVIWLGMRRKIAEPLDPNLAGVST